MAKKTKWIKIKQQQNTHTKETPKKTPKSKTPFFRLVLEKKPQKPKGGLPVDILVYLKLQSKIQFSETNPSHVHLQDLKTIAV